MTYIIIKGKSEQRAAHWRDIQTRVTTHEGELLSGEAGKKYQQKWSKEYLGRDLSDVKQATANDVEAHEHSKQH